MTLSYDGHSFPYIGDIRPVEIFLEDGGSILELIQHVVDYWSCASNTDSIEALKVKLDIDVIEL